MKIRSTLSTNQAGLAPFVVTFIMVIVITIIVLGFSQITTRNSRESVDSQLSTQAYYAAESGVNAAQAKLEADPGLVLSPTEAQDCSGENSFIAKELPANSNVLSAASNVSFTCVLVNKQPSSIVTAINQSSNKVYAIDPSISTNLTFNWSKVGSQAYTNCNNPTVFNHYPTSAQWNNSTTGCPFGILRLDITQNSIASPTSSAQVATLFITPKPNLGAGTTTNLDSSYFGATHIANAGCSATSCSQTVTLNGLLGFTAGTTYYVRLTSIYEDAGTVTISPTTPGATFPNAQAVIDATGKAQDELRRIQVRLSLTPQNPANNAISAGGQVCKLFSINTSNHAVTDPCP